MRPRWIALAAVQLVLLWAIPKTGAELPQLRLMLECSGAADAALYLSATVRAGSGGCFFVRRAFRANRNKLRRHPEEDG
jgi:hypothetical protein